MKGKKEKEWSTGTEQRHIVLVTVRSPLCLQLTPKQIDQRKTDRPTDLKITTPRSES